MSIFPYILAYSERVPFAQANGFFIRINPKHKETKGYFEHEYEHVKQFWIMWLVVASATVWIHPALAVLAMASHSIAYALSSTYRLWAEVQAYRKQMEVSGNESLEGSAEFLATGYSLKGLTTEKAMRLIRHPIK